MDWNWWCFSIPVVRTLFHWRKCESLFPLNSVELTWVHCVCNGEEGVLFSHFWRKQFNYKLLSFWGHIFMCLNTDKEDVAFILCVLRSHSWVSAGERTMRCRWEIYLSDVGGWWSGYFAQWEMWQVECLSSARELMCSAGRFHYPDGDSLM